MSYFFQSQANVVHQEKTAEAGFDSTWYLTRNKVFNCLEPKFSHLKYEANAIFNNRISVRITVRTFLGYFANVSIYYYRKKCHLKIFNSDIDTYNVHIHKYMMTHYILTYIIICFSMCVCVCVCVYIYIYIYIKCSWTNPQNFVSIFLSMFWNS